LPPVGSARSAILLLECIEHFTGSASSCFGSLRYGSLLIKRVTLPLRLANLFRGTSRRLIFCFSFFSTLHSYARRNHDVIVADVATSAIVYRPSVVAKFHKTAKADGALLVFHFHLALCGCGSLFRCGRYPFIGGFASIVAPRPSGDLLLRAKHLFVAARTRDMGCKLSRSERDRLCLPAKNAPAAR
jgi:hypothetical protein